MVEVGDKAVTRREAAAHGRVRVNAKTFQQIQCGGGKKGDVLATAQLAGIMGAKRTADLIPLCHPLPLTGVELSLALDEDRLSVEIEAVARCTGPTGVEMEALTAVAAAALTVYDMCKAVQRDIVIEEICLLRKSGGKSGTFVREAAASEQRTADTE